MVRGWRMAMMAAMKNVLSPISLTKIIDPLLKSPSRSSLECAMPTRVPPSDYRTRFS